ncbi:MAG TPA: TonB-dependent receptor [Chitinophagaceae bacterium]|nr:TonB-dependent receptor [Chitinophagaceae bacterium]
MKQCCKNFGIVLFFGLATTVSAQQQLQDSTYRWDSAHLEQVVVTGTMRPGKLAASPVAVEVYQANYFQKNPSTSLFQALEMVNGVRPQLTCNVCNTGEIRMNGLEGPYTMVTIDGMPIVSALGTVYGYNGIPNSMIERVEIVKGPFSTLYGSEAVAGVINIITKSPLKAPQLSTDISSTSYGENNIDISAAYRWGKRTHVLTGFNHFNFNRIWDINNDGFTDVTLQNRTSVFQKITWGRQQQRAASLVARYVYEDRWGGQTQWQPKYRGGDVVYGESIYTNRIELLGLYQLPINNEKINLQWSYNFHGQNSVYGNVPYVATQHIAFAQLFWDKQWHRNQQLLAGTTLRYTWYDDNTGITTNGSLTQPQNQPQRTWLPGVFVQNESTLGKQQQLVTGIRVDHHPAHGFITAPRINYKLKLNDRHTLRLGVGNGFRVVNVFSEDHAAYTGARRVVITEALAPEKSFNINMNYSTHLHTRGVHTTIDVSLFYNHFTNKIIADYFTNDNEVIYNNLNGNAVSRGFSLNTTTSFAVPLRISAGITWVEAFQKEKNALTGKTERLAIIQTPPLTGTLTASYDIAPWRTTFDVTANYTDRMYLPIIENDPRPERSPAYSLWNLQVTKKWQQWQLYTGVKNIFNFLPQFPIIRPADPFDKDPNNTFGNAQLNPAGGTFDPNYNYAPLQARRWFVGIRWQLSTKK